MTKSSELDVIKTLEKENKELKELLSEKETIKKLEAEIQELKNNLTTEGANKDYIKENDELKRRLEKVTEDFEYAKRCYGQQLERIDFERFLRLNYRYLRANGLFKYLWQVLRAIKKMFSLFFRKVKRLLTQRKINYKRELKKILKENKGKKIILFYPGYEWYMKMYQRPQHMAIHFAEKDYLFFYCSTNINDGIDGFSKITEGLYITNLYEYLRDNLPEYTLYVYANMNGCYSSELEKIFDQGNHLLYEYIDDLHEDLTSISKEMLDRHKMVLTNKDIPVVTTAKHLYDKAKKIRGSEKNLILSTNGVVYEDFHITKKLEVPEKIKDIVAEKKPIIGYYGALAKWFDYELIEKTAKAHPEWNILLIGIDYDKSFAEYNYFEHLSNVHYIGIVEYKELIKYGNCCSALTIPFVINEITLSTSPVKVFEYMSMEKPIVTTDLPECRKYKSVMIGKTHDEFIKKLEIAVKKQDDKEYKALLKKEALENTWTNKVNEIVEFIDK